jgi:DNA-binding FadR family transcriptional regulator
MARATSTDTGGGGSEASVFGSDATEFPMTPKRKLAYVEIAGALRDMILQGTLSVGQKLPSEPELARHFGTSRATMREALTVLTSENLIRTTRGATGGRWVAKPEYGKTSDTLEMGILRLADESQVTVDELLEMREIVETPTAMLAALRREDVHIDSLRETVVRVGGKDDSRSQYEANRHFHKLLAVASGNRLATVLGDPIFGVVQAKFARDRADPGFWDEVVHDHASILEAVELRDWREAGLRMSRHLQNLQATYTAIERKTPSRGPTHRRKPSDADLGRSVWLALLDLDGRGD